MINGACTYILIIADNDMDKLKLTIDSLLKQTVDMDLLRILLVDNASKDGTYSHLIDYEIRYPHLISVIREKKPTTQGRLLKHMIQHLRFAEVGSSMIMYPGDVVYPDFIKKARMLLELQTSVSCLVYETDIWDGKTPQAQVPIFRSNCIITKLCQDVYYRNGIGHKVQILYRGLPIELGIKLPYYEVVAKCHEWLSVAFYRNCINCYMKESAGCVYVEEPDIKNELIEWSFFIKRNFYALETQVFSTKDVLKVQKETVDAAYNCLAIMALQYAVHKLKKRLIEEAEDALVFAEMMNLNIGEDERYEKLKMAISEREYHNGLEKLFEMQSETPPWISFQF